MAMAPPPPPPSSSTLLRLPNSSISLSPPTHLFFHPPKPTTPNLSFIPKATSDPDPGAPEPGSESDTSGNPFESRLSQVRIRYRSGTGKKAEARKQKKGKKGTETGSGGGVFLPPVALKEPVSGGLKVDFGFSPYSERLNGRLAGLGLAGLLLVELGTGKSTINYHTPSIVFIQLYFMAAVCALYCKYEKEKVSVWPEVEEGL